MKYNSDKALYFKTKPGILLIPRKQQLNRETTAQNDEMVKQG
jgi:hypothetical protein